MYPQHMIQPFDHYFREDKERDLRERRRARSPRQARSEARARDGQAFAPLLGRLLRARSPASVTTGSQTC